MRTLLIVLFGCLVSGCVSQPSKTFELSDAINKVRVAIGKAQMACKTDPASCQSGLLLSGGEVTLELTETSSHEIGVSLPVAVTTLTGSSTRSRSGGSTLTLKLDNPLFGDKDGLAAKCVARHDGTIAPDAPKACETAVLMFR